MADTSVIAGTTRKDESVPYELGKPNWRRRRIPDIRNPSSTLQIKESQLIDVLILGDGFQTQEEFESGLQGWINDFYKLKVYDVFRGAFRIRALFRESSARASENRDSYYRVKITRDADSGDEQVSGDTGDDLTFRQRVFADVDSFSDINLRRYPSDLTFDEGKTVIGDWLFGMHRNLVVCILVHTNTNSNVSGRTITVPRPAPDEEQRVRIALGAYTIHEFSHAFGLLSDEYIDDRESQSDRVNPTKENLLNLSNLSYSTKYSKVAWLHLSPWGRDERQAAGSDPSPVLGWAWVGGVKHRGVWHSEYRCLMNGRHDNFQYTQVSANDPTAQTDGSYMEETGASLRDRSRFCLWCQELVVMRILERTDQFQEASDPPNFVDKGQQWYLHWKDELRNRYWELFDVSEQIQDYEINYANMNVGPSGEALETSDLYAPFGEDEPTKLGPSAFDESVWLALLG